MFAKANSKDEVNPWAIIIIIDPDMPQDEFIESPIIKIAMCLTDE